MLDAATPNTGTMPTNSPTTVAGGVLGTGTEATGASTARDATDVAGSAQQAATMTAQAVTGVQRLGLRRFVSRPLAAHTFATADGSWTFSYAGLESNTNHNATFVCAVYVWRPGTGAQVGASWALVTTAGIAPSTTAQAAYSGTGTWNQGGGASVTCQDQDILVFDVYDQFNQGMASAYTSTFDYNGTTEASTTSCASFITPPAALTLYTAPVAGSPDVAMARTRP